MKNSENLINYFLHPNIVIKLHFNVIVTMFCFTALVVNLKLTKSAAEDGIKEKSFTKSN